MDVWFPLSSQTRGSPWIFGSFSWHLLSHVPEMKRSLEDSRVRCRTTASKDRNDYIEGGPKISGLTTNLGSRRAIELTHDGCHFLLERWTPQHLCYSKVTWIRSGGQTRGIKEVSGQVSAYLAIGSSSFTLLNPRNHKPRAPINGRHLFTTVPQLTSHECFVAA